MTGDPRLTQCCCHQPRAFSLAPHSSDSIERAFFKKGQVIETFRSSANPEQAGIYQGAIDEAIQKVSSSSFVV